MSQNTRLETEDRKLSPPDATSEEIKTAIRRRAAEINREELRTALDRLRADGDLTDAQERIVRDMAGSIVADMIGPPESFLAESEELDRQTRVAIIELFDPNS